MLELPRISEDRSTRKLVPSTPRLSFWTVGLSCVIDCVIDMCDHDHMRMPRHQHDTVRALIAIGAALHIARLFDS